MFSALIIDGQQRNRIEMRRKLAGIGYLHVVGEAGAVTAALAAMQRYAPNLLFVGMGLADGTAFDLMERMGPGPLAAHVVLLAETERHAVRAFKYGVFDYLVGEPSPEELRDTVERLRGKLAFAGIEPVRMAAERIALRAGSDVHMVQLDEVVRCESSGNCTTFHLSDGTAIRASGVLKEFEDRLKDRGFLRCHQAHLINLEHLVRARRYPMPLATMDNGEQIPISARKMGLLV